MSTPRLVVDVRLPLDRFELEADFTARARRNGRVPGSAFALVIKAAACRIFG